METIHSHSFSAVALNKLLEYSFVDGGTNSISRVAIAAAYDDDLV